MVVVISKHILELDLHKSNWRLGTGEEGDLEQHGGGHLQAHPGANGHQVLVSIVLHKSLAFYTQMVLGRSASSCFFLDLMVKKAFLVLGFSQERF